MMSMVVPANPFGTVLAPYRYCHRTAEIGGNRADLAHVKGAGNFLEQEQRTVLADERDDFDDQDDRICACITFAMA